MSYAKKVLSTTGPDLGFMKPRRKKGKNVYYGYLHVGTQSYNRRGVRLIVAHKKNPRHCALLKLVKQLERDEELEDDGILSKTLTFDLFQLKTYVRKFSS